MSVTVSYKGEQIASISTNASKTLKTGGKYCEGDITLNNVESGGGDFEAFVKRTITSVTLDVSTLNGSYNFSEQKSLTSVSFPNLTAISVADFFRGCSALTSINFPELTSITGGQCFYYCSNLQNPNLPKLSTINSAGCFANCPNITQAVLPSLTSISGTGAFGSNLQLADLGSDSISTASIGDGTFRNNSGLKTVVLRYSAVPSLAGTWAFNGTPIFTGADDAYIYVPQALISDYQQAVNWTSYYATKPTIFQPIEGSEYE